jgi:hypothetical protein
MNPFYIAICALASTYSSALFGLWIRHKIPSKHVGIETKSLPLTAALITTISGFILGMLVTTSMREYADRTSGIENSAVNILSLDRQLAQFGPETKEIRESLRDAFQIHIDNAWHISKHLSIDEIHKNTNRVEEIMQRIHALKPKTDSQGWLKSNALEVSHRIQEARWFSIEHSENSVPKIFFVAVIFWLTILFCIFGFLGSKHASTFAIFFMCSICVSTVIYLIVDINSPYSGLIQTSSAPLQTAVQHLCK